MTMAYQEHDDAAYAADAEGPAPSADGSPTAASFRRQRSARNRELGLYGSRLRQHHPPTKRDDAASNVEPLGFEGAHAAANDSLHSSIHTYDDNKNRGRALLGGSPRGQVHKTKFDFDDSPDEEAFDDADLQVTKTPKDINRVHDDDNSTEHAPRYSPTPPVSPRWASAGGRNTAYSYSSSHVNASVPVSVHTSVASAAASTAPTSPISPTPSSFASRSLLRSPPSSPASAPRFPGLSSHPIITTVLPERSSASTDGSSSFADKPDELLSLTSAPSAPYPSPIPSPRKHTPSTPTSPSSTMIVGNFSRPRQVSASQSSRDELPAAASRLRQPEPVQVGSPAPTVSTIQPAWPRERARGLSISSSKSTSTFASLTHRLSNDHLRLGRIPSSSNQTPDATSPGLPRPQVAYSRGDAPGSSTAGPMSVTSAPSMPPTQNLPQPREPRLAPVDGESRSSYRSQWTSSTAHRTLFTDSPTARSSILTKTSSRTSMSWFTNAGAGADEGLSVDDVMGLYEKGFADSTGAEDNDGPFETDAGKESGDEQPSDAEGTIDVLDKLPAIGIPRENIGSGPVVTDTVDSQILEAMSEPLPIPGRSARVLDDEPLETPRPVRYSGLSSFAPNESGFTLLAQHMNNKQLLAPTNSRQEDSEKRDSAKMLESDDKPPGQLSPLTTPQLNASFDSRPGSSKAPSLFARPQNEPEDPGKRDRYGFCKENRYITREQYDAWNGPYTEYIGRRRRKWVAYLRDSGMMTDKPTRFPPPSVKTKRFIRKGIPPEWRGAAWFYYAGGPSIVAKHPGIYDQLIVRASRGEAREVAIEDIERDLHRTFPDNVAFQFSSDQRTRHSRDSQPSDGEAATHAASDLTKDRQDEPRIVSKLRRVLLAFSIYNPRIGYCQSLNFLAGLLLLFVETEEQCFWLLNVITRIFLPGTHEMSLEGSKVDLGVLMSVLQESLPAVSDKICRELEAEGPSGAGQHGNRDIPRHGTISRKMKLPRVGGGRAGDGKAAGSGVAGDRLPLITVAMTSWFMSCFIGTLPIETTLRVWDIFFYEGSKTLFRIALAIFKLGEPEIRAVTDPMEMYGVVQSFPRRLLDGNLLMETTFRRRNGFGHLSQEAIEEKRRELREAFKEARLEAAAGADMPSSSAAGGASAAGNVSHAEPAASATVNRKGTLFGRRREQRAAEVM